jgi:hypothetical protein
MVIMISALGILNIIPGTIGVAPTPGQTTIEGQLKPSLEGAGIQ